MIKTTLLGGGLAVVAAQALAAPLTLDPDGVVRTDPLGLTGIFPGTGFQYTAESADTFDESAPADIEFINDSPTGVDEFTQELTISRADGASFDLEALDIPEFFSGFDVGYFGTEEVVDPEEFDSFDFFDQAEVTSNVSPLLFDLVRLSGVTTTGETVEASLLPYDGVGPLDEFFYTGENADPIFDAAAFAPELQDLVSLTFTTAPSLVPSPATACLPENLSRADPAFGALASSCEFTAVENAPGIGLFNPSEGELGTIAVDLQNNAGRNDFFFYQLDAITVDTMAPIPVPASLPLLAGGLGILAYGARRRTARRG